MNQYKVRAEVGMVMEITVCAETEEEASALAERRASSIASTWNDDGIIMDDVSIRNYGVNIHDVEENNGQPAAKELPRTCTCCGKVGNNMVRLFKNKYKETYLCPECYRAWEEEYHG